MEFVAKLKAISDANRLEILRLLLGKRYCVQALAKQLGITAAAVSQHIRILKEAGFLVGEKQGYFMHYEVDRAKLQDLAREIEGMLVSSSDAENRAAAPRCQCRSMRSAKSGCCKRTKGKGDEHD